MSEFTKGDWNLYYSINGRNMFTDVFHYFVVPDNYRNANDMYIAAVPNEADARLIAYAPEMYEAIKKIIDSESTIDTVDALFDAYLDLKMLIARIDNTKSPTDNPQ